MKRLSLIAAIGTLMISIIPLSIQAAPLSPDKLEGWCGQRGGTYDKPTQDEIDSGFAGCCTIKDNPNTKENEGEITCCTTDGFCKIFVKGRIAAQGSQALELVTEIKIIGELSKLKTMVEGIANEVAGIKTALGGLQTDLGKVCTAPDLLPLATPALRGGGYCRRNVAGQLLVQVYNQGGLDATGSMTRVLFGCADTTKCSSPTEVDLVTPALPKFGGSAELAFDIPEGCFNPDTNICEFKIGVDAENVVIEGDEVNNNVVGDCGPGLL